MTPFYSVVIVFSKDKKKILLGKRREDGKWTSPAGGAEIGETPKQTAIREAFEEANLKLTESDLKELPSCVAGNEKPIFLFYTLLDPSQKISTQNDPDREVPAWKWFNLDSIPKLDKNRQTSINNARMVIEKLLKSIISTDMRTGVDVNTEDYSLDEMASKTNKLTENLRILMEDAELQEVREWPISAKYKILMQKYDEGIYTASIVDFENGDRMGLFKKLTIPSIVQGLKIKEFLGEETEKPNEVLEALHELKEAVKEGPPEGDSDVLIEAPGIGDLSELMTSLKNIHVEGDLHITIKKSIDELVSELLEKATARGKRGFPVGTKRTWSGQDYVKHGDGSWVAVGGKHHGKAMGNFKNEPKQEHINAANEEHDAKKEEGPKTEPKNTEERKTTTEEEEVAPKEMGTGEGTKRPKQRYEGKGDGSSEGSEGVSRGDEEEVKRPNYDSSLLSKDIIADSEGRKYRIASGTTGKPSKIPFESINRNKTNSVGHVAFGKASKKAQEELNERLQACELIIDNLNVKFKTPIDFVCQNLSTGRRTHATYNSLESLDTVNHRINIKGSDDLQKSLLHEIGHAIDYSMGVSDKIGRDAYLSHSEITDANKQLMQELTKIAEESPEFKRRSDKKYLSVKTEIFARGFEVLSYKKARELADRGVIKGDIVEDFTPDYLKAERLTLDKELTLLEVTNKADVDKYRELDSQVTQVRTKLYEKLHNNPSKEDMLDAHNLRVEAKKIGKELLVIQDKLNTLSKKRKRSDSEEIIQKVSTIMEQLLSTNTMNKSDLGLQLELLLESLANN
jgi:8-oxo-dGTP pyrophosphatase MutT (NUDIX family)